MTAGRTAFRTAATMTVAALALFGWVAATREYAFEQELWLLRSTGYAAAVALVLSLSASPLRRVVLIKQTVATAYRRVFGMTAAWLGLLHAGLVLTSYLGSPTSLVSLDDLEKAWQAVLYRPHLRAGGLALAILILLLVTSYPSVLKLLRIQLWKHLHRLSYLAALLVFQHLLLSPFAPRRWALVALGFVAVGMLSRLAPARGARGSNRPKPSVEL